MDPQGDQFRQIILELVEDQSSLQTLVKDLQDEMTTLRKQDSQRRRQIQTQEKQIEIQKEEIEKQKEEGREQKKDMLQYFGLFVAIFTAISIL